MFAQYASLRVHDPEACLVFLAQVVSATLVYVVGNSDIVLKTADGGITWTALSLPTSGMDIYSASFIDGETGWLAGKYSRLDGTGSVYKTVDGGVLWERQSYSGGQPMYR